MIQKQDVDNRIIKIFTTFSVTLIMLILSGCFGITYPTPIPCGDTDMLISAIQIANADPTTHDIIELDAGCDYKLTEVYDNGGITGSTGLPQITSPITILGHESTIRRSDAPGIPKFRLFIVGNNGDLTLQNLNLQNGYANDPTYTTDVQRNSGGAIRNTNLLSLKYVTIQNNNANGVTGGIFNEGDLEMISSSISGSEHDINSWTMGGAVALHNYFNGATATISKSAIYGNGLAVMGYSITNSETSTMSFENTTISGNGAGALNNDGIMDLIYCTIVGNGLGIHSVWYGIPTVDMKGTLWQNNTDCDLGSGVVTTNIANMDSDGTCGVAFTVPAAAQGVLPLANNGGATLTHALDPSSPAINAVLGPAVRVCPVPEDQRGVARPQYTFCDIGAYEFDDELPPQLAPTPVSPQPEPGDEQSQGPTITPTLLPDRCDLFDSETATLTMHDIAYGTTTLELFVQFKHPLWGWEEEIPWDTRSWEYTATFGTVVADKCAYREYPGRIYCTFELTKDYFGYAYPLNVVVNFCNGEIFSHSAVSAFAPAPPATDTQTPIACHAKLNKSDCSTAGGKFNLKSNTCDCP